MPRPKDPAVRAMLLERAAAMLRDRQPVTLRALVDGTGVSTMAVYTHFGGIDQLWGALRQEGFTRLDTRLADVPVTPDPVEHLTALGGAYVQHALDLPDLYRVMFDASVDLPDLAAADATLHYLVDAAARAVAGGRFAEGLPALALATQTWVVGHGIASLVATGPLGEEALDLVPPMLTSLFLGFGDDPTTCRRSVARGWLSAGPSRARGPRR